MKKRLFSCLALLLLCAILLCSCAEGLPLSELYFAAKNAACDYSAKLELLKAGSMIIAENGKSEYVISYDHNASAQLKDAINALNARIKKQTGADLLDTKREEATKQIVIGRPVESTEAPAISAAQFYLGFQGDTLTILAHNDVMLISALSYFGEKYLSEDNDFLILSPDLAYLSPVATYRNKEHALIRAEQTGDIATQAAANFCDTLFERTGIRFSVKSDFNSGGGMTDILFGYPDDKKAQEIIQSLGVDDFYIGVLDGRLMILAKNDPALSEATELFLSTFVTAENAAFDKEEKTISLPTVCEYYRRSDAILLVEEGINRTVLIYPANANSTVKNAAHAFANRFMQITNTELPVHADTEFRKNSGSFEILLGKTNRDLPNQSYLDRLPSGQWVISTLPEENAISVFAQNDLAMLTALDRLWRALYAQMASLSQQSLDEDNTERTLFVKSDFSLTGLEPPSFPVAANYTFYNGSYRFNSTVSVNESVWDRYNKKIRYSGFTRDTQSEENGVVTTVYRGDARKVTLIYNKNTQSLSLRVNFE